jgi:enoyl-[acyl-carrier protein] reductase/trans-2-enoyl-CoA reductase (NAD+)
MDESREVVVPRMKGYVALSAHPAGCARNVAEAVDAVELPRGDDASVPPVLVIGCSTGYGLASAIVAGFRHHAPVLGVCLERPAKGRRTASAGWYNVAALQRRARSSGLDVETINADCFRTATKEQVVEHLRRRYGGVGTLIYSVAAPVRVLPRSGETARSAIKPLGRPFRTKTVQMDTGQVIEVELPPATDAEAESTRQVMGGDDWQLWVDALRDADLLASGFRTVAYTYVGSELTSPIYRSGTIGMAKEHLEATAQTLDKDLQALGGSARTSVNSAAVTQAAAAIPAVPLYVSLLLAVTRDMGIHFEEPIEQIARLWDELDADRLDLDAEGRIRLDGWELRADVQEEIARRWSLLEDRTVGDLADVDGFRRRFRQLFGFDVDGVDYEAPVVVEVPLVEA